MTWGGQLAVYDVSAGIDGAVTPVKRRVIEGREHMAAIAKLVELEAFESCIRRWRLNGSANTLMAWTPPGYFAASLP